MSSPLLPVLLLGCFAEAAALLDGRWRNGALVVLWAVLIHATRRFVGIEPSKSDRLLLIVGYVAAIISALACWVLSLRSPQLTWALVVAMLASLLIAVSTSRPPSTSIVYVHRLQWLTWALLTTATLAAAALVTQALTGWPAELGWTAVLAPLPLACSAAAERIPRSSLLLPRLLRATVTIASLAVALLTVVGVVLLGLGRLPDAGEREVLLWAVAGLGAAALVCVPLRSALLARAGHAVYRGRPRPETLSSIVTGSLTRTVPLEDTLIYIAERARSSLELARVSVWIETGQELERVACDPYGPRLSVRATTQALAGLGSAGARGWAWVNAWIPDLAGARGRGDLRVVPIARGGDLLGLVLAELASGAGFTIAQEHALGELAAQLGPVLRTARLDAALAASMTALRQQAQELRESRARVVTAADAERRRIERDLHDGAQQHLVGLAFNLRAASALVQSDPRRAAELLRRLEEASAVAVDELRALCQGVYPAALTSSGIGPALDAAAARLPLAVYVDARMPDRFAPDVEAAIYFVCLELIQNAAKHGGPAVAVRIAIEQQQQALLVTVTDDGIGFDAERVWENGGLTHIRDRVGALGGTVEIDSQPGRGTRVAAVVPLGSATPRPRALSA